MDGLEIRLCTMNKRELLDLYGVKVYSEFAHYKDKMLKHTPEVIFAHAYQIDLLYLFMRFY